MLLLSAGLWIPPKLNHDTIPICKAHTDSLHPIATVVALDSGELLNDADRDIGSDRQSELL